MTLELHDIRDVYGFVRRLVSDELRARGASLNEERFEDVVQYLAGKAWELSLRYDPSLAPSFKAYAGYILQLRFTDWLRTSERRTRWVFGDGTVYERPRRHEVSLDEPPGEADGDDRGRGLYEALASSALDPAVRGDSDLRRLFDDLRLGDEPRNGHPGDSEVAEGTTDEPTDDGEGGAVPPLLAA